jgi:hypothetical protein
MATGDFRRVVLAKLSSLAAAFIIAGACSSDNGVTTSPLTTDRATTTSAAQATSTTPPTREAEVIAAYRAHWEAWYAAAQIPDPALPAIAQTTTGSLLEHTHRELEAMRAKGERVKGDPGVAAIDVRQPRVLQFQSETTAILSDCYLDNTVRYDSAGKAIGTTEPTYFAATATIVRVDAAWKVASLQLRKGACRG